MFEVQRMLLLLFRICLGFFFLPSALKKLVHHNEFVQGVQEYQILRGRSATAFAVTLPWVEFVVSLSLLAGIMLPVASAIAALLLVSFIVAVSINLLRGNAINCNCYGLADTTTISWGTVGRNLILLIFAFGVWTIAAISGGAADWLSVWRRDGLWLSEFPNLLLIAVLEAFCVTTPLLVEWALDIYYRISRLRISIP